MVKSSARFSDDQLGLAEAHLRIWAPHREKHIASVVRARDQSRAFHVKMEMLLLLLDVLEN